MTHIVRLGRPGYYGTDKKEKKRSYGCTYGMVRILEYPVCWSQSLKPSNEGC